MLKTIEEICDDVVSQTILRLLADGWMPIKVLVTSLNVDRHTAYRRFEALEKHNLIKRSKRRHQASRYRIFGFNLTESGKIIVQEHRTAPSINLNYTMHSFEHNYTVEAKLYAYPDSKAKMFTSNASAARHHLTMGLHNMLMELTRDPNIILGNCRLILDCNFKPIAELDVYEFYNKCLSPSLESYIKNRTFRVEKKFGPDLSIKISECPDYALNLIKLTRFIAINYSAKIGKENIELINAALDVALKELNTKHIGWADRVSSLIVNAYLFMLASIYHLEGQLPEPEVYFELWYISIPSLKKLKKLYVPLRDDLQRRIAGEDKSMVNVPPVERNLHECYKQS